ncbi:MAG: PqiC family protein [Kofleriaceae bacterium]
MNNWTIALVAVVACRSAPSRYYTLVAPADDAPLPASNELQLEVLPVDVPPDVDRADIVVREGPGEVTPVDTRAWIAPLRDELRRAFSDDLSRALGARDVAGLTPTTGVPVYRVKLAVQRFESVLGDHALIEAVSTVREAAGSTPALVCSHRAREAAHAGYEGIAEAHQRALIAIGKQVAADVRAVAGGHPACAP